MGIKETGFDVFRMFDTQWGLATAGTLEDFDGCTISWGSLGNIWGLPGKGKPIITIYINCLRYTYDYLMKNEYFTVSFFDEKYKKDLGILGSKSKRDTDKFALTSLTPESHGGSVIFTEANLTLVCRKIYHEDFNAEHLAGDVRDFYAWSKQPPHTQFIGEITELIGKR